MSKSICGAKQWTGFYMITASVMKELSIFPNSWHKKKSLAQLGRPANNQNNYIKLSGFTFRLDVTRFLQRGKFFNPENSFAGFCDQPYTLLPFFTL